MLRFEPVLKHRSTEWKVPPHCPPVLNDRACPDTMSHCQRRALQSRRSRESHSCRGDITPLLDRIHRINLRGTTVLRWPVRCLRRGKPQSGSDVVGSCRNLPQAARQSIWRGSFSRIGTGSYASCMSD